MVGKSLLTPEIAAGTHIFDDIRQFGSKETSCQQFFFPSFFFCFVSNSMTCIRQSSLSGLQLEDGCVGRLAEEELQQQQQPNGISRPV